MPAPAETWESALSYDLIAADLQLEIPALYGSERDPDPTVWVKIFTPDTNWTWYVIEYAPSDGTAFGLVIGFEDELGYFTLADLQNLRGPLGLRVERDIHFDPTPLSKVREMN